VRDTAALPADIVGRHLALQGTRPTWRNIGIVLRVVDQRASVLDASNLLEDAALDRYEFIRDGYLQRRESQISTPTATVRAAGEDRKARQGSKLGRCRRNRPPPPTAAAETSAPVSSESAPKELNSGTPSANRTACDPEELLNQDKEAYEID
jgi:phospholipid-binding lipoprotein MlaA